MSRPKYVQLCIPAPERMKKNTHRNAVAEPSSATSSALMPVSDVKVFRHEFITIFRYSHSTHVHPADIHVLYAIDDRCTLYEEDKGTVFLARDVMAQLQKLIAVSRRAAMRRPHVAQVPRMLRRSKLA